MSSNRYPQQKVCFSIILKIVVFLEFGNHKKCRGGAIIHRMDKGGMGSKSLRTPVLE